MSMKTSVIRTVQRIVSPIRRALPDDQWRHVSDDQDGKLAPRAKAHHRKPMKNNAPPAYDEQGDQQDEQAPFARLASRRISASCKWSSCGARVKAGLTPAGL